MSHPIDIPSRDTNSVVALCMYGTSPKSPNMALSPIAQRALEWSLKREGYIK